MLIGDFKASFLGVQWWKIIKLIKRSTSSICKQVGKVIFLAAIINDFARCILHLAQCYIHYTYSTLLKMQNRRSIVHGVFVYSHQSHWRKLQSSEKLTNFPLNPSYFLWPQNLISLHPVTSFSLVTCNFVSNFHFHFYYIFSKKIVLLLSLCNKEQKCYFSGVWSGSFFCGITFTN